MLFAGWEVRIVKNCDRGLEHAARGRRLRVTFSRPQSQFFAIWIGIEKKKDRIARSLFPALCSAKYQVLYI